MDANKEQDTIMLKDIAATKTNFMIKNHRAVDGANMEENQLYAKIMNNIETDLMPIVGYTEEPLLSLVKACAPLVDIIHNFFHYVQIALNKTPEEPPYYIIKLNMRFFFYLVYSNDRSITIQFSIRSSCYSHETD